MGGLALVAARVAQHEGDVTSLGILQRIRRHWVGGHQRLPQARQIQIRQTEIEQQRVEPRLADGRGNRRRVGRGHRVVACRAQHCQQRLAPLRVTLEHEQMHGTQHSNQATADFRLETGAPHDGASTSANPVSRMPASPDLKQLDVGDRVEGLLRVVEVAHRDSARGAYTTLKLGNRHGELSTAPFWAEQQPHIAGIERGAVEQIIAEIGQYNGRRQLKVGSLRMLSGGAVDWRALVPTVGDVAPYWDTLDRWRSEIRGHGSREHREPLCAAGRPAS